MAEWVTNQNDDRDNLKVQLRQQNGQDVDLTGLAVTDIRWNIKNRATGAIVGADTTTIDDAKTGQITLSSAAHVAVAGLFDILIRVTFLDATQKSWPLQNGEPYVWTINAVFA